MTPRWFDALKKDPKAAEVGVQWFSPAESEARRRELLQEYDPLRGSAGQNLSEEAFSAARALAKRYLPVGLGPTATARLGQKTRAWLLLDTASAPELKVALSPLHAPFFWLSAGQSVASLREALAPYFLASAPAEETLERTERGLVGTGAREGLDLLQLHARYQDSAFLDGVAWGSAYPREPAMDSLPRGAAGRVQARRFLEQSPTHRATFSFRSLHSRSLLTAEAHEGAVEGVRLFIVRLRYRPAKQSALIRALNQRLGSTYPEDLPIDLAGALTGLPFDTADTVSRALTPGLSPASLSFALLCLEGLAADNASAEARLRPFSEHPEGLVRQLVAHLAMRRGLSGLLADMAARETHPELKQRLVEAVRRLASD